MQTRYCLRSRWSTNSVLVTMSCCHGLGEYGTRGAFDFEKLINVALGSRFSEQIPLAEAAALAREPIEVFAGLDPFGGGMQAEAMPQPYDCVDDFCIFRALGQRLNEA